MTYEEYIKYVIARRINTNYSEVIRYYRGFLKKDFESITEQAVNKQRKYISSDLFKDLSKHLLTNCIIKFKGFSKYNGYYVLAGDASIFDLPVDKRTITEMKVKKNKKTDKYNSRARVSCFMDVFSNLIVTAKIVPKKIPKVKLAISHLLDIKDSFDLSKIITTYNRGYASLELMVVTECLGSKFLIRLKKNTFKNKVKKNEI